MVAFEDDAEMAHFPFAVMVWKAMFNAKRRHIWKYQGSKEIK